jgi:hypothetical protein
MGLRTATALLLILGTALADPITYNLVAREGQTSGFSTLPPAGTITFADGSAGASSYNIETQGTEFDLSIAGFSPAGPGWSTGDTAEGTVVFGTGVIGDETLIPSDQGQVGSWFFTNTTTNPDEPFKLRLYADIGGVDYQWDFENASGGWQYLDGPNWYLTLADSDSSPVPEPSAIVLVGLGMAGVIVWRRKRRCE